MPFKRDISFSFQKEMSFQKMKDMPFWKDIPSLINSGMLCIMPLL